MQRLRVCQPRGQKVLHELDGGQVRRAAAHQLPALGRKAELCPESKLCGIGGQRGGKYGGRFAVIAAVGCAILLLTDRNRSPCAATAADAQGDGSALWGGRERAEADLCFSL